ncbi:putative orphan protein [Pseudoalteromonas translucida]|uniref:Orphan protein n=2 Tax=Pseudoalteromonas TaxID=53246 RepID=Q3II69_PSET1|nr:putative orphan protein [Pseudoalteromonas translucida]
MRANKVAITLDTQTLVGVAKTLENIKGEGEFLVLQEPTNKIIKIRLDKIKTISLA